MAEKFDISSEIDRALHTELFNIKDEKNENNANNNDNNENNINNDKNDEDELIIKNNQNNELKILRQSQQNKIAKNIMDEKKRKDDISKNIKNIASNKDLDINEMAAQLNKIKHIDEEQSSIVNSNKKSYNLMITSRYSLISALLFILLSLPYISNMFLCYAPKIGGQNNNYAGIVLRAMIFMILFMLLTRLLDTYFGINITEITKNNNK